MILLRLVSHLIFIFAFVLRLDSTILNEYDYPVPQAISTNPLIFLQNLFYCHVIPFGVVMLPQLLLASEFFKYHNAVALFIIYMRDLVLIEILDFFSSKFLPPSLLFNNGSFFLASSKPYFDLNLAWYATDYRAIFACFVKGMQERSMFRNYPDKVGPGLLYSPYTCWHSFGIILLSSCLSIAGLNHLFAIVLFFVLIVSPVAMLGTFQYLSMGPVLVGLMMGTLSARMLNSAFYGYGKVSIFDPYYRFNLNLMAMGPYARGKVLGLIDTTIPPDKLKRIKQAIAKKRKQKKKDFPAKNK